MSKFLVFAFFFEGLLWGAPIPSLENCHFYLDLEKEAACWFKPQDDSNYLVEYGYKYCRIFKQKALAWEDERTAWVDQTAFCLQNSLSGIHDTCQHIEQRAFDSHPGCYRQAGFCKLGIWQKTTIVMTAMGLDFLLKPVNSFYQTFRLVQDCASDVPLEVEQLYAKINALVQSGQLSRDLASSLFLIDRMSSENLNLYLKYFKETMQAKTLSSLQAKKILKIKNSLSSSRSN
jgi:hypothetical protein